MAGKTSGRSAQKRGVFGTLLLGLLFMVVAVVVGGYLYLRFGPVPVATADTPFPYEKQITHVALNARVDREKKTPPFGTSEDVYEGGAHVYKAQCAPCHGVPGHDSPYAKYMYPTAPQLWKKHGKVVGVSDDDAGETYWKVENGIRLTGMPSFSHVLTEEQMWQVSLLMKNADQEMPQPVTAILEAK